MHSGQLSQVEEEPRSLSGFRAKSYAPTQCSRDLASLTDHLLSEGNPTPPAISAENVLLDRIKRDTAAASALLNAHKTQDWALLEKLRLAAIRNDEAPWPAVGCANSVSALIFGIREIGLAIHDVAARAEPDALLGFDHIRVGRGAWYGTGCYVGTGCHVIVSRARISEIGVGAQIRWSLRVGRSCCARGE
jgi:hypothetical protein